MVIEWIVDLFLGIIGWLLDLMPTWTPPSMGGVFSGTCALDGTTLHGLGCDASNIGQKMGYMGDWFNISLMLTLIQAAVAIWLAVSAAKAAIWVYEHLPFKGT